MILNSFIDKESQTKINASIGDTLIRGTYRMCDLVPAMLEAIKETPEFQKIKRQLPDVVVNPESERDERWESDEVTSLYEELTDILESYAPEGYYFGAHVGDGSDFGFWMDDERMLGIISEVMQEKDKLVLDEDIKLNAYMPYSPDDRRDINAHEVIKKGNAIMVGDKDYKANINQLDDESVELLFKAVEQAKLTIPGTKYKAGTILEAQEYDLPESYALAAQIEGIEPVKNYIVRDDQKGVNVLSVDMGPFGRQAVIILDEDAKKWDEKKINMQGLSEKYFPQFHNGKLFNKIVADAVETIIERTKNPTAKAFSPEQREILDKVTFLSGEENILDNFNKIMLMAEEDLHKDGTNEKWILDTRIELMDYANGKSRGNGLSNSIGY